MSGIIDVSFVFKRKEENDYLRNIKELLIAAIFDPNEKVRLGHVETLNRIHKNHIQRGFVADNQLCLSLTEDSSSDVYCICDTPKTYCGRVREPHRFYRDENGVVRKDINPDLKK